MSDKLESVLIDLAHARSNLHDAQYRLKDAQVKAVKVLIEMQQFELLTVNEGAARRYMRHHERNRSI